MVKKDPDITCKLCLKGVMVPDFSKQSALDMDYPIPMICTKCKHRAFYNSDEQEIK